MEFEKQHKPYNKNWQPAELQKKMVGLASKCSVIIGAFWDLARWDAHGSRC